MHENVHLETGQVEAPSAVRRPPAPGEEVAGPPLTDLVYMLREVAAGQQALFRAAQREAAFRSIIAPFGFQLDANGDGATELFVVPQGATAYLTRLVANLGDTTPGTPVTSATLWHAIVSGQPGSQTAAQLLARGSLLAFQPDQPAVDAQLPAQYQFGDLRCAPALVGPEAFHFVVDAATASTTIAGKVQILVFQPEP